MGRSPGASRGARVGLSGPTRLARRVALAYLALAGAWILASDYVLHTVMGTPGRFELGQTSKGLGFVAVTAGLLFLLVRDGARRLRRTELERAVHGARTQVLLTESLLSRLPITVWTVDTQLRFTTVGGSLAEELTGPSGLHAEPGMRIVDWFATDNPEAPAIRAHLEALAGSSASYERAYKQHLIEARLEPLRTSDGEIVGAVGVALDISERHRIEAQLREAATLEAVARLAGGIAHDFNNLLTAVLGFLSFARDSVGEHPAQEDLEQAETAARRAADLTQQLLTFARRRPTRPELLDVDAAVRAALPLLQTLARDGVELELVEAPERCPAWIDHALLDQVLMSLVGNARDAAEPSGHIRISTGLVELAEERDVGGVVLPAGSWTTLAVADDGPGIPPAIREHVFEPFFTTKPVGKGTGLGLSTARGTVEDAGGRLGIESEPGAGTTVTVYLPRPGAAPEPGTLEPRGPDAARAEPRRALSVLLVEDEELVRQILVRWLEELGHAATEAATAAEALAELEAVGRFDAVLTDVTLPDGDGLEIAARLAAEQPGLPVFVMSGRNVETDAVDPARVLAKPFDADALAAALETVEPR